MAKRNDNPLKWLVRGPVYLALSPLILPIVLIVWLTNGVHILFGWAFSDLSWKEARKEHECYIAIHPDF